VINITGLVRRSEVPGSPRAIAEPAECDTCDGWQSQLVERPIATCTGTARGPDTVLAAAEAHQLTLFFFDHQSYLSITKIAAMPCN
jgi:hypothetical protein